MIFKSSNKLTFLFSLLFAFGIYAQNSNIKGYKIKGEDVIFIFDINDYPNIKYNGDTIDDVFISGEFNNWALDQWKMNKVNDSIYQLRKKLSFFTTDFDWEFKFIVNSEHWAEPTSDFENIANAKTEDGKPLMVYNLKLYSAFVTDYGNVSFKLKGYTDAEKVVLSGTFNRWDETGFKMKPTEDGWKVTVQKNVEFRLCDYPDAKTVLLSGDFNDWSEKDYVMTKIDDCWIYNERLSGGKYHYKFIIDGKWITDPENTVKEYDYKGNINSVCMVK